MLKRDIDEWRSTILEMAERVRENVSGIAYQEATFPEAADSLMYFCRRAAEMVEHHTE